MPGGDLLCTTVRSTRTCRWATCLFCLSLSRATVYQSMQQSNAMLLKIMPDTPTEIVTPDMTISAALRDARLSVQKATELQRAQ